MSTAQAELYDLANQQQGENTPNNTMSDEAFTKKDLDKGLDKYFTNQQRSLEEAEKNERIRKTEEQNLYEKQELQEVTNSVRSSLQKEMQGDKEFAKLVQTTDLPGSIISFIAETADPEDAPLIIRELANNDEYKQTLKNTKTKVGVKKLLNKVNKAVLMGGVQKMPPMAMQNIPQYNYNNSPTDYDKNFYSDLAMRHGI